MGNVTIREALARASSFLQQQNITDHQFVAELLLRHVLQLPRARFYASLSDFLNPEQESRYRDLLKRRAEGEPVQYILGTQEFYGLELEVNTSVLIPRPETEILVEQVGKRIEELWDTGVTPLTLADVGTGSGAIPIALAKQYNNLRVIAVDIAQESLDTARRNAYRHGVENRIRFVRGDLLHPLIKEGQKVDIMVSNPPYIPTGDMDGLDTQVKDREPRRALDGGEDGLLFYRRIIRDLPQVMNSPGLIGFEVGIHQANEVRAMLDGQLQTTKTEVIPDLASIDRVVIATI